MKLNITTSGRFTYLYAAKSFMSDEGKCTTKVVKKFGTVEELKEQGIEDPIAWAQEQVDQMTEQEKEEKKEIVFSLKPEVLLNKDEQRSYNGGYLFLQKVYNELGLDGICKKISSNRKME